MQEDSVISFHEYDRYVLAKSYFDLKEYDRAAYFSEKCTSQKGYFLHVYSRYLAGEKKRVDDSPDSMAPPDQLKNENLRELRRELQKRYADKTLDGYCLYLYGVVLKKLDLTQDALEILVESLHRQPLHWTAWLEVAGLITDKDALSSLSFPNHWVKQLFLAHCYMELQMTEEALSIYVQAQQAGLQKSTYILAQVAIANHDLRCGDQAVSMFKELQKLDPYRLDNMDTFSHILYVKEMRVELSYLAHHAVDIDKYRVETCCIIGNYYSLRGQHEQHQHEKAVLYFQRALKLNPNYLSAWTLMGHEFMELKNTHAAIQAYRQAIEVNKRDYRAWYGLGQTYEILKMPYYCLYYYRQAQILRPNDSRMLMALGDAYEKLEKLQYAKKCFWKAHCVGDLEGTALIKLARLYDKLMEEDQAAAAYATYVSESDADLECFPGKDELGSAYLYLANYHLKHSNLEDAYINAQRCTENPGVREEGKALLRQIANIRSQGDTAPATLIQRMDDMMSSAAVPNPPTLQGPDTPTIGNLSPMNLTFTP